MFKLTDRRRLRSGLFVGAFAFCAIPGHADELQQDRTDIRATAEAASESTIANFVRSLAIDGVPGGAILPGEELRQPPFQPTTAPGSTEIHEAISAFSAARPLWRATEEDGFVFLERRGNVCSPALSRTITDIALQGQLHVVGKELMRKINPNISAGPPSLMSRIKGSEPSPVRQVVSLFYQRITVRDAFNELSRQARGVRWVFAEETDKQTGRPKCVLNWVHSRGTLITSYDLLDGR